MFITFTIMSTSESTNIPPSPPPESPRRGSSTPQSRRPRGSPAPPPMGVPGQSAFTPYTRPPPPPPPPPPYHWVFPVSSRPSGSGIGGFGFGFQLGAQTVPVGGSGSGRARLEIGGNPSARKRVRDSPSKNPAEAAEVNQVSCSLCGKVFMSPKALFGHMRSHPGRGWRGAHPPPAFRPEEEFADIRAAAGGGDAPEGEVERREEAAEEEKEYRVPDLNNPPPAED